jgi:hypothetical protein
VRLFDGIDPARVSVVPADALYSPAVTHLRFVVRHG